MAFLRKAKEHNREKTPIEMISKVFHDHNDDDNDKDERRIKIISLICK